MTAANVAGESDRIALLFISSTPLLFYGAAVLVSDVLGNVLVAWPTRAARLVLLPSLFAPVLTLVFLPLPVLCSPCFDVVSCWCL